MQIHHRNLPRVVVVGGGFGGLAVAVALRHAPVRVTLIDRQNHHLFQPLLYQVATAALSPSDIAEPLRHILRKQENCEVLLANAETVDVAGKSLRTETGDIPYDYLVIAVGTRHSYFGHEEWEQFAPGLKSLDDALEIRRRMLLAFELAERTTDDAERRAAMTFLVVGGGPTGVEMAGAIAEIARQSLLRDFRHIDSSQARIILLDNSPRVLSTYVPELSESAAHQLADIGVDVRVGSRVQHITEHEVTLADDEKIAARTIVWAAGNVASPLGASLGVPLDRAGRVIVQRDLTVPGHPEIFVIGDIAHCIGNNGEPLPGLAPVAMQQGRHAAENIIQFLSAGGTRPFVYLDKGTMATIGRYRAVADLGFTRFSGFLAWLSWLFIHLLFLVSFRSKIGVLFSWGYTYLVFGRKARLITGRRFDVKPFHPAPEPPPPPTQASVSKVRTAARRRSSKQP